MTPKAARENESGFALLLVMWSLALLTLLISQIASTARTQTQIASNLRAAAALEAQVEGAVQEAVFNLLNRSVTGWIADGRVYRLPLDDGTAEVRVFDEAGKVNPNTASPDLLRALLRALGISDIKSDQVAQSIADWRIPIQSESAGEVKLAAYRQSDRDYGPAGLPFVASHELRLVAGVTDDIQARMLPHLSMFQQGKPDPALAGPIVREALQSIGMPTGRQARPLADLRIILIQVSGESRGARIALNVTAKISTGVTGQGIAILTWETP